MTKIFKKIYIVILAVLLFAITLVPNFVTSISYAAEETQYLDVLTDLRRDSSFNTSDFPIVTDDFSLQVFQVAESVNNELFVYVYHPCGVVKATEAKSINISTDGEYWHDYTLELLSESGVFGKYKVVDFTVVRTSADRYYNVSSILRDFISGIDPVLPGGQSTVEKSYEVSRQWNVTTEASGDITYTMIETEIVTITDKFVGFQRYNDGFYLAPSAKYTDGHYVAFSCDWKMDKLYEADVSFAHQPITTIRNFSTESSFTESVVSAGTKETNEITVYSTQKAGQNGGGLFSGHHTWNRIQSVADFLKTEENRLYSAAEEEISSKQWVLRFYETPYKVTRSYLPFENESQKLLFPGMMGVPQDLIESTRVTEVMILRLKFEKDGKVYNLGIVDDKTSGSDRPTGGDVQPDINLGCSGINWKHILAIVLLLVLLIILAPFLPYVIQAVIWIVSLPFKLIAVIIKSIKNAAKKKK